MDTRKTSLKAERAQRRLHCERWILGKIFLFNDFVFEAIDLQLKPDHFVKNLNRRAYTEMIELSANGSEIDPVTVFERLKRKGGAETGELADLLEYANPSPAIIGRKVQVEDGFISVPANFEYHVRAIQEAWIKKTFLKAASHAAEESEFEGSDAFELLGTFERSIQPIYDLLSPNITPSLESLCIETTQNVEAIFQSEKAMTGISTGFKGLDRKMGGLLPGNVYTVAARPGMGKTAFVTSLCLNLAGQNVPTGFISAEMSGQSIVMRMKCALTGVPEYDIHTKKVGPEVVEIMMKADDWLCGKNKRPIYINDKAGITIDELKIQARKWVLQHGIKVLIVDYVQNIVSAQKEERLQIKEVIKGLGLIAKQLRISVVALAQVSREAESEADKRPKMKHLAGSSWIEAESYMIAFMVRPEKYFEDFEQKGLCEFIIEKHRNGPTGIVQLRFIEPIAKFVDWVTEPEVRPVDKVRLPMKEDLDDDMQGFPF